MKNVYVVVMTLTLFLGSVTLSEARSGCCSWHGGVSHCDSSVGRYVCNDGTYSPTCGCPYAPRPTPKPLPTIPPGTNSSLNYYKNIEGGVDLVFDWDRPDQKWYSLVLSKNAGGDPSPKGDTSVSTYTFRNVQPGRWYINVKEAFGDTWSQVSYWTVDVPNNVKQIAQPYPTPTPIATPYIQPQKTSNSRSTSDWITPTIIGLVGAGAYHLVTKGKNQS